MPSNSSKIILAAQPVLFAIFFILVHYNSNIDELVTADLIYVIAVISPVVAIFTLIMKLIIRDYVKSILVSSFIVTIFFVYVPLHDGLYQYEIGRHSILLPLLSVLSLISIGVFIKLKKNFEKLVPITFVVALFLVSFNIVDIAAYSNLDPYTINDEEIQLFSIDDNEFRDVYFILLDELVGTDALQKYMNYDNSDFDKSLKEMGFFIPEKSLSNYNPTIFSVPSLLNMAYIDPELELEEEESVKKADKIARNNMVMKTFEKNGYEIVYFYNEANMEPVESGTANELCNNSIGQHQFLTFILDNTPIVAVKNTADPSNHKEIIENRLCVFNGISTVDEKFSGPLFVYAHIMLPHPPIIFESDGTFVPPYDPTNPRNEQKAFLDQLNYTSHRAVEVAKELLAKDPQPIVVIASDHGYIAGEITEDVFELTFSNFAAYYFPDVELKNMEKIVTPVNTFPILFNNNFGTNYELKEDRIYMIGYGHGQKEITDILIPENKLP